MRPQVSPSQQRRDDAVEVGLGGHREGGSLPHLPCLCACTVLERDGASGAPGNSAPALGRGSFKIMNKCGRIPPNHATSRRLGGHEWKDVILVPFHSCSLVVACKAQNKSRNTECHGRQTLSCRVSWTRSREGRTTHCEGPRTSIESTHPLPRRYLAQQRLDAPSERPLTPTPRPDQ